MRISLVQAYIGGEVIDLGRELRIDVELERGVANRPAARSAAAVRPLPDARVS